MAFDLMRRYPEAFFCYREAVTQQPYEGQFWFRLGNHFWERGLLSKAEEAYLVSERCPHGGGEGRRAEDELRRLPEMQDVPKPPPGANPLDETMEAKPPEVLP